MARDSLTRPAHTPSPPPPVPDALVAAIAGDRSVVVLGAGASAQAGYPTGEHLLHQLVQELGSAVPASIREAAAGSSRGWGPAVRVAEFGTIIEALLSVTSRDHLIEVVRGIFARVTPDRALFTTLSRLSWRVVLPLAWDSFADEFFLTYRANRGLTYRANRGAPRRRIALEDTAELRNAIRASDRLLLRALGDLDRPASLSLTIEDFRRALARTPDFQRQLTLLLQTQTFLFIGVGVDTLKNFLQAIGADLEIPEQRHFALIPDDPANDIYRSPLKRYGIELLEYDAHDDHVEVARFVERLAAQVTHEKSSSAELPMRAAVDPDLAARRIARVRLHNIGLFDELDIKFPSGPLPDTESLPWTVVFAPNGCGKSTFLRAIGLVMAGHDPRVRDSGAHLLKAGQNDGWIEVQIGSDTLRTTLVRDRGGVLVRSSQTTPL